MKKRRFYCDRCQIDFEVEVVEPGEAEEKRLFTKPVACPKCGGTTVRPK